MKTTHRPVITAEPVPIGASDSTPRIAGTGALQRAGLEIVDKGDHVADFELADQSSTSRRL
jgi:hypothetical protein